MIEDFEYEREREDKALTDVMTGDTTPKQAEKLLFNQVKKITLNNI